MSDAMTTLLASWEEQRIEEANGATIVRLSSGERHTWAIFSAVLDRYNAITGRPRPTEEDLQGLFGEKVTLVKHGENMFGGGMLVAQEGTISIGSSDRLMILPKRARRKGFLIGENQLLDVLPGYSTAEAQDHVDNVLAHLPTLRPLTQDRLLELPEDFKDAEGETLSLCAFGTHRLPDSEQADALLLFGAYMREDDIVDRGVVLVRPEHGISEHGSMYGQQLLNGRFGEVVGYEPITFTEAIQLCDLPFEEAYARVVPA